MAEYDEPAAPHSGEPPSPEPSQPSAEPAPASETPPTETPAPTAPSEAPYEPEPTLITNGVTTPADWEANAQAARQATQTSPEKFAKLKTFFHAYWQRKKWTLPVTIVVLLILLLGIPFTRDKSLGLFIKHNVTVSVLDSSTGRPVSSATVASGKKTVDTDANGKAVLHLSLGPHQLAITKKFYTSTKTVVSVPLFGNAGTGTVHLVATGRQVPVTVTNKITNQPLANAQIDVSGSKAKTDKNGKAIVVLSTKEATQQGTVQLSGYNSATVTVTVTDQAVKANDFTLTPAGKVYFLSNLSGTIDVVKTNLDGSGRKTVLAGTGKEDAQNTALLASRDWKYLALLSKRSGQQGIYLIDTSDDSTTNIDGGNSSTTFTLVGWSDDIFIYQANHSNVPNWQSGAQVIKSYDAAGGKLYSIDQTQGEGTGQTDYGYNTFSTIAILDNELVYAKSWYGVNGHLNGKNDSFMSVHPDGSSKKDVKDFPVPSTASYGYTLSLNQFEPYGVYVQVPNADNTSNSYEIYENGQLNASSSVNDDAFNKVYPTYLLSPNDKQTFWSEVRDNRNTMFVGDENGKNPVQIASLSEDTPYGWFTDNYLLVSSGGSELYIMPASGSRYPLKITDYYKPQLTFRGYGGGYGGL